MKRSLRLKNLTIFMLTCLITPAWAYDAGWTRSDCSTYSYHGLYERYVYAGNMGWIDNNIWDSSDIEGVDCSAYVSRCLALPDYVAEGQKAGYPYSTYELFFGVDHTVRISSIYDLQAWDLWVWRSDYGGPTSGHTGLFKQFSGSYIVTREAANESSGIVERNRRISDMIDWGCRYYRRENWTTTTPVEPPTVETHTATGVLDTSATLNAEITDDGNGTITGRGFAWGTTSDCDDGWITATASNDTFSALLDNLRSDKRYYFQAMAQNSAGWGYGQVLSFTTDTSSSGVQIIIDNSQSGTSYTGTWGVSSGPNPYGTNSLWSRDGATYTWSFNSQAAGMYDVFMWWTEYDSRGTAVPVAIYHASGTAQTTVNQQTNGGQWNSLGQYYFNGSGSVRLTANGSYPTSYCADAVKFVLAGTNQQPVAVIDSITPQSAQVGQQVIFVGHGTDDGTITAYQWISSIDGLLGSAATLTTSSLSEGTHTISFRVRDNLSIWSETVEQTITVTSTTSEEVIIDNDDAQTSSTGTWKISGGADPWGANSLYGRDGATYTWDADTLTPGLYEVFMWWTEYYTRSSSASIRIQHENGTAQVSVNQQENGGQWNSLGQYYFDGEGIVTLYASSGYPLSYCADAVKFVKLSSAALTAEFSANPISGSAPLAVQFTDLSSPGDTIYAWRWDFDNNGIFDSSQQNPTFTYTTPGTYTVRLVVYADDASDELVVTDYIEVFDSPAEEIIVDNSSYGTSSSGTWGISGGEDPYGSNSLWARDTATYRWNFTPQQGGRYEVFLWWTEYYSRGTHVPVAVKHRYGTASLTVNQQNDGGQWNSLGTYRMLAGQPYYVQVSTSGDGSTTCADAVRIEWVSD